MYTNMNMNVPGYVSIYECEFEYVWRMTINEHMCENVIEWVYGLCDMESVSISV